MAAGEHVVDVPATLAARVRLLGPTTSSKNDANDALSTAVAGLRHAGLRPVPEWVPLADLSTPLRRSSRRLRGVIDLRDERQATGDPRPAEAGVDDHA